MVAFAQLAVVGRGSNKCVYVIVIFTMSESTEQCICIKFFFKSEKPQRKHISYCSKHTVKMKWVVHKCLTGSVDLQSLERRGARCEANQRSCYWRFLILRV